MNSRIVIALREVPARADTVNVIKTKTAKYAKYVPAIGSDRSSNGPCPNSPLNAGASPPRTDIGARTSVSGMNNPSALPAASVSGETPLLNTSLSLPFSRSPARVAKPIRIMRSGINFSSVTAAVSSPARCSQVAFSAGL